MYCLYPAKMWANEDSLLMSKFSAKTWWPPCSSRKTRNMWSHHSCHAASRCPRRRCDEQNPGTNRSYIRVSSLTLVVSVLAFSAESWSDGRRCISRVTSRRHWGISGSFRTVLDAFGGESELFDSDVCAWWVPRSQVECIWLTLRWLQVNLPLRHKKDPQSKAISSATPVQNQSCIPTISRYLQQNWRDFPTTGVQQSEIDELMWRWPPSKNAWPNVMQLSSEVGSHQCATEGDFPWLANKKSADNGWFQLVEDWETV